MLVLVDVELLVVVESQAPGLGHPAQAVHDGQVVRAGAGRRVVPRRQLLDRDAPLRVRDRRLRRHGGVARFALRRGLQVPVEAPVGLLRSSVQVHELVRADEEDRVGPLGGVGARVEANDGEFPQLVVELLAEPGELPQVQRAEIQKEVPVNELVVDVEEVDLLLGGRRVRLGPARRRRQDVVRRRRLLERGEVQSLL